MIRNQLFRDWQYNEIITRSNFFWEQLEIKCDLNKILMERGIERSEFAKKIGVSNSALNKMMHGRVFPTLEIAFRISEHLDIPIEQIWFFTKDKG